MTTEHRYRPVGSAGRGYPQRWSLTYHPRAFGASYRGLVSVWVDVGSGHRVRVLADGVVLWEHPTPDGYQGWPARVHQVSPREGERWVVVSPDPLTLSPSLHCDPGLGGCGAHVVVTNGSAG